MVKSKNLQRLSVYRVDPQVTDSLIDYAPEVERLRKLEFGDRFEPFTRLAAVSLAGGLIHLYTGWSSALVWSLCYIVALGLHLLYLVTRRAAVRRREVVVAALLFAVLQASYAWLPVVLFIQRDPVLVLVGGALIVTQLLFILRRSDTLPIYNAVNILGLMCLTVAVYIGYLPTLQTGIAQVGSALALLGVNYYFWDGLRTTRRMQINQDVAARQALQAQKMAAIGKLAGGVAHDFNNNLTAIIGSLEILQLTSDVPEHKQDIDNALIAAQQAAMTVRQLMLFARVEKPRLVEIALTDIVAELDALTRRLIPTSVNCDMSRVDAGLVVRADRHQLLTGLINLVVNSVDAMPQGGILRLEARPIKLTEPEPMADGSLLAPGDFAWMTITDSGHGIPPDLLVKVIDPFFTTKPVGKGTGLGLSMVTGIMREFGGGLSIRSEPGRTAIDLFLPLDQGPRPQPDPSAGAAADASKA